ncbi:MAG: SCP2 sterol-binding domain-containing protein [Acidimicrobiales bacterium]|nr:SCP2 sterol-binding domain-containing protein [Acidimicrobiales bacterium]
MPSFLSPDWVAELDRHLSSFSAQAATSDPLTLQYVVSGVGSQNDECAYTILIGQPCRATAGRVGIADVTFFTNYDTAMQIALGTISAQEAFIRGQLKVQGDVTLLLLHARTLEQLNEALAALRSATKF